MKVALLWNLLQPTHQGQTSQSIYLPSSYILLNLEIILKLQKNHSHLNFVSNRTWTPASCYNAERKKKSSFSSSFPPTRLQFRVWAGFVLGKLAFSQTSLLYNAWKRKEGHKERKESKRVDTLTFILQFWISRIEESIDYVQVKLGSSMV